MSLLTRVCNCDFANCRNCSGMYIGGTINLASSRRKVKRASGNYRSRSDQDNTEKKRRKASPAITKQVGSSPQFSPHFPTRAAARQVEAANYQQLDNASRKGMVVVVIIFKLDKCVTQATK